MLPRQECAELAALALGLDEPAAVDFANILTDAERGALAALAARARINPALAEGVFHRARQRNSLRGRLARFHGLGANLLADGPGEGPGVPEHGMPMAERAIGQ